MYGYVRIYPRAPASIAPHSGSGGCTPRPIKLKDAQNNNAAARRDVQLMIIGITEFGMICENMIRKLEQLDAFAACTYSFSRMLRICALKIRERAATFPIAIAITVS